MFQNSDYNYNAPKQMYKKMLSFLDSRMEICNYLHFSQAAQIASISLQEGTVPPPTVRNTNNHLSINQDDHSGALPVSPPAMNLLLLSKRMKHQSVLWVSTRGSAQDTAGKSESPTHFCVWKKAP